MSDIAARIERSFEQHRDAPALWIEGRTYSYSELRSRVLAIQGIVESTVGEPLIGIAAADSLDTYASVLAVLRAGRAFVPINPQHPVHRNKKITSIAGLGTLLVPDAALLPNLSGITNVSFVETQEARTETAVSLRPCASEQLAYLLFTSGSTGEPKGVPITRGNLGAFLDSLDASGHGVTAADRVLQMFDLTFDFSIASYLAPFCKGACVFTVPPAQTKFAEVYRLLADERLTVAPLVPSVLTYLRPYFREIRLPNLRLTVLCGEALIGDIATEWAGCAPMTRIANFYGPTEATVFATVYDWAPGAGHDKTLNGVVSIGRPMPHNMVAVVDSDLRPVAAGEKGELCLAGPQLSPGYWRDDARNDVAFFELPTASGSTRFYRTGDIVVADADGDHYFCGRIGTQIKLQGFRVELGEIEYHARAASLGCACVVIPRIDKSGSAELSLIVENYQGDPKLVLASLRARVPPYMVPKRALSVERLPTNQNGKVDRAALTRQVDEAYG